MQTFAQQLHAIRGERHITQEQLAQELNVSRTTVSRWETGSNMPDVGMLVELADFYNIDLREIIDGERKSERTEKEEKETLHKVADYAEAEKKLVVRRRCIVTFVATLMFALSIMIGCIVFPNLPADNIFRSGSLWLGIGVIGVVGLWGIVIRENRKSAVKDK